MKPCVVLGARRSTLLHSFSTNDATLGEYKYTVAVGSCVLKITCSNHDIVRVCEMKFCWLV